MESLKNVEKSVSSNDERPVIDLGVLIRKIENSIELSDLEQGFLEDVERTFQREELKK